MLTSPAKKSPTRTRATPPPINWQPKVSASVDFLAFCNSLEYTQSAIKDSVRVPDEKRLYGRDNRKIFGDNLISLVDNFRNTEDTLDKEKRKIKEVLDEEDLSKIGGDETASRAEGLSVAGTELKKLGKSGELSGRTGDAIFEGNLTTYKMDRYILNGRET